MLLSASAFAECANPKAPDAPDGKSASKDQMVAAMQAFKQYNTDVNAFVECLNTETTAKVSDGSIPPGQIMQFKSMQGRKQSAATDELKAKTESFNEQVRVFKAKGG
jgi:hypothetical protein